MNKIIVSIKQFNHDYTAIKNIILFEILEQDKEKFEDCLNHARNVSETLDDILEILHDENFTPIETYTIAPFY